MALMPNDDPAIVAIRVSISSEIRRGSPPPWDPECKR